MTIFEKGAAIMQNGLHQIYTPEEDTLEAYYKLYPEATESELPDRLKMLYQIEDNDETEEILY